MLDVLRGTSDHQPEQIADKLKEAAEQSRQICANSWPTLRQETSNAESQAANAANEQQLDAFKNKQQDLRREISKLARQLDRLQAADASQSAQSAANRLDNQKHERQSAAAATATECQQRREKAEEDLADSRTSSWPTAVSRPRTISHWNSSAGCNPNLTEMVERQKKVIDQTATLHDARRPNEPLPPPRACRRSWPTKNVPLAQMAKDHSEVLHGLGAVRVSLEEAERRLLAAAALLDGHNTGPALNKPSATRWRASRA